MNQAGEREPTEDGVMVVAHQTVSDVLTRTFLPFGQYANELEAWQSYLSFLRHTIGERPNHHLSAELCGRLNRYVDAGILGVSRRSDPENQRIRVLRDFLRLESNPALVQLAEEFVSHLPQLVSSQGWRVSG